MRTYGVLVEAGRVLQFRRAVGELDAPLEPGGIPPPTFLMAADLFEVRPGAADEIRSARQIRLWWRSAQLDTPIDLFLPASPMYHRLVVERAQPAVFLGAEIKVLTATDLMVFKMLFDRRRDWADTESLIRADAGDDAEAADWVAQIVGPTDPRLAKLQEIRDEVNGEKGETGG